MNKQQLAARIWESANRMRSKIEANEYKDYILGFIFYKFLSDREEQYLSSEDWDEDYKKTYLREEYPEEWADDGYTPADHEEMIRGIRQKLGYFIAYDHLFSTWLSKGSDFNVADVRDALSAFSRLINSSHRNVFDKVFDTLQTGLSKLGDSSHSQTRAISDLLYLIKDIPMDGKQDYDVLGFIYEYLIEKFASNAGKKAGEFYTPHEVSLLMSEIAADHLKDRDEIRIFDPTSGSGSLLINIGRSAARYMGDGNRIKYYAQELKENTYNLTRMNLVMRGILPDNIVTRNADTLEEDWPYFDESDPVGTYEPLYVDAVVSNPPYSQNWNPADRESDPRYAGFGLAPKGKADYAFLLHDLYHLKPDGIMTIILPHGVLFRGGEEGEIRRNLIEKNHIDAIIGLPANIFYGTGIPTIIMVLKQKRSRTDVLIVDASKGFEKLGKNNRLRASDIRKITDVVTGRLDVQKFSRTVSRDEIRANDYNLNIPRYVDSSEKPESWNIYASMYGGIPVGEIAELDAYWTAFPGLRDSLFAHQNSGYVSFQTGDLKTAVRKHPSVQAFVRHFSDSFNGFDRYLGEELINTAGQMNISKEETVLSEEIFRRLSGTPLVDPYEAYQILDDHWSGISVDLEIIQTEGFTAARQVDPHMILKKKDGRDQEVQDGWTGHVLPFELVQQELLGNALSALKASEDRLSELSASYEEELEALPEEEKDRDFVSEDHSAFVWPEVKKTIRAKDADPEILLVLKKVSANNEEEKKLKKQIKEQSAALQLTTRETIEHLSDEEVRTLLHKKWVIPLVDGLTALPDRIISDFSSRLEKLASKYDTTFEEVENQIRETEKELAGMLDQLTGDEFDLQGLAEFKKLLGGI